MIGTLVVLQGKIVSYTAVPDLSDPETERFVQATAGLEGGGAHPTPEDTALHGL